MTAYIFAGSNHNKQNYYAYLLSFLISNEFYQTKLEFFFFFLSHTCELNLVFTFAKSGFQRAYILGQHIYFYGLNYDGLATNRVLKLFSYHPEFSENNLTNKFHLQRKTKHLLLCTCLENCLRKAKGVRDQAGGSEIERDRKRALELRACKPIECISMFEVR